MVACVQRGQSLRAVARRFQVSLSHVQRWVRRAGDQPLREVDWSDLPSGCRNSPQRMSSDLEDLVLQIRKELKEASALGEYGAAAIQRALRERRPGPSQVVPSLRTIGRILERRGVLDGRRRIRRQPPPRGWFLADVAAGKAELDSFDIVEDLVVQGGIDVNVLNGISLHGGLCASWPRSQITAKITVHSLIEHWRAFGLPRYAKFDNDTVFQGAHQFPDTFGRVTRTCLSLGVTPVFTPPQETGFQADIENYNGRWQAKVWQRFHFQSLREVIAQSQRFVEACRERLAARIDEAPQRRRFPERWQLDLQAPLRGVTIFLRRTDERGMISLLGHSWKASSIWCHRLVRAEVDLRQQQVRIYALRRRDPSTQPLLSTHAYTRPKNCFQG